MRKERSTPITDLLYWSEEYSGMRSGGDAEYKGRISKQSKPCGWDAVLGRHFSEDAGAGSQEGGAGRARSRRSAGCAPAWVFWKLPCPHLGTILPQIPTAL